MKKNTKLFIGGQVTKQQANEMFHVLLNKSDSTYALRQVEYYEPMEDRIITLDVFLEMGYDEEVSEFFDYAKFSDVIMLNERDGEFSEIKQFLSENNIQYSHKNKNLSPFNIVEC